MQYGRSNTRTNEDFATGAENDAVYQRRYSFIASLSALSFLFIGATEILVLLFGNENFAAEFPLHNIVLAGLSFGLCALATMLMPEL
jgi:peptidoglycan biosynthesis protein MviN/MurJ (putative lipid II flippase)